MVGQTRVLLELFVIEALKLLVSGFIKSPYLLFCGDSKSLVLNSDLISKRIAIICKMTLIIWQND